MAARRTIRRVLLTLFVALVVVGAAGFAWVWFAPCWLGGCAPLDNLAEYQAEGSQIYDVSGKPIGMLATVNRRIVSLDSLPPYLPHAFVAVEDQRFYEHGGIDFRRLFGALLHDVKAGSAEEGASTITQQLARNLFPKWLPYQARTLRRKILEARVARQLERRFSKDKILELYLNHIYLGEGAYGVDAAARTYFGKPASELDLPEAATLAALPKAPSDLDPIDNPDGALDRRNLVLDLMAQTGYISRAQAASAKKAPLGLSDEPEPKDEVENAYFISEVRQEMQDVVGDRFYTAGLKIYTTLDSNAQQAAEEELKKQLRAVESGRFGSFQHPTYAEAKGKGHGQTKYLQGAFVLMDAQTGGIRALVGGRDFDDSKFDRALQAKRQPGSAFKPFVYLTALERYGTPAHAVLDQPVTVTLASGQTWSPDNYGGSYAGWTTMRRALEHSRNAATVRIAEDVGLEPIIENAHRLGVEEDIPPLPSTALGAAVVRPIELVRAYAAFANGGELVHPHFIRRIVDRHGAVVWEAPGERAEVLNSAEAFVLTSMLKDVVDQGTGHAVRLAGFRGPAAGKTGTTNDAADVWFVGYTPEMVGAVWMGFDDPQTIIRGASGGTLAAPVWGRIMRRVYANRPTPPDWAPPAGVSTAQVEVATGRVVGAGCPARGPVYTEYFIGSAPFADCAPQPYYATGDFPVDTFFSDTLWRDEEWGDTLPPVVGADSDVVAPGIRWPELADIRRKMKVGEPNPPAAARDTGSIHLKVDSATTRRPSPPEPKLLGHPVGADSASADSTSRPLAPGGVVR